MKYDSRMKINMTEKTSVEKTWKAYLNKIEPADRTAMELAKKRWNSVAKPIGSLGILEEDIIKIAGIRGNASGMKLDRSALAVMCADHGVVAEGVSQTSKDVTRIVAENFTKGETSTSKMCRISGTDLYPVDMGMDCEPTGQKEPDMHRILDRKVARGSGNIAREPAMSRTGCLQALLSGIDLAFRLKEMGYEILAAGEMGIGNTTPAAAMSAVLTGLPPEEATGRGAGLSDAGLEKKKKAVEMAVSRFYEEYPEYRNGTKEQYESGELSAVTVLAELGGFDLAGMTGLFLGGAAAKIPVLTDGFLSTVSGLLAVLIRKEAKDYMLASHISTEPAGTAILQMLDLPAPLHMGMHLGEGSGAVAMIPLLRMGEKVYEEMSTFSDISVEQYVDYQEKGERP